MVQMISLIIGNKGSGKTKRLIEAVNNAADTTIGNVVCIEKGKKLMYDISHKVRLIDTEVYNISGYESFYGFISGMCAADYDVTDILIDATLRIGGRDLNKLAAFFKKLSVLSSEAKTNLVFTVSCDESDLPAEIFESAKKI